MTNKCHVWPSLPEAEYQCKFNLSPNDTYDLTTLDFISVTPHYSKSSEFPVPPGTHICSHPLKPPATCLVVCVSGLSEP